MVGNGNIHHIPQKLKKDKCLSNDKKSVSKIQKRHAMCRPWKIVAVQWLWVLAYLVGIVQCMIVDKLKEIL